MKPDRCVSCVKSDCGEPYVLDSDGACACCGCDLVIKGEDVNAWIFRCKGCRGRVRLNITRWTMSWIRQQTVGRFTGFDILPCRCGGILKGQPLKARKVDSVRCDARCTNAVGPSCDCSCGGENHGTN